jgi:hypothetical protein
MSTGALARTTPPGLIVECRGGSLARAGGRTPAAGDQGELQMSRWKELVGDVAAHDAATPVTAVFFGGANLITGYRLYYLLRYAKRAGLRDVTLLTDGRFWIDEATDWLMESEVDRVAVVMAAADESLEARIARLESARAAAGRSRPQVVRVSSGAVPVGRTINWRGEES